MTEANWTIIGDIALAVTVVIGHWRTSDKVQEIHLAINSRLDQLVASARKEGHAAGIEEASKNTDPSIIP